MRVLFRAQSSSISPRPARAFRIGVSRLAQSGAGPSPPRAAGASALASRPAASSLRSVSFVRWLAAPGRRRAAQFLSWNEAARVLVDMVRAPIARGAQHELHAPRINVTTVPLARACSLASLFLVFACNPNSCGSDDTTRAQNSFSYDGSAQGAADDDASSAPASSGDSAQHGTNGEAASSGNDAAPSAEGGGFAGLSVRRRPSRSSSFLGQAGLAAGSGVAGRVSDGMQSNADFPGTR
jgi:hypothetical protein